jgi:hypothetical protein
LEYDRSTIVESSPAGVGQPAELPTLAIFFVGLPTLLLEVLLTRIFSVTMWYHFAFVAISLALFGISASGVLLTLRPGLVRRERLLETMAWGSMAFAITIPLAFVLDLHIPFQPFEGTLRPYLLFFCKFLVLSLPFFCSGFVIALAFTALPQQTNKIYFADLAGGGLGCALVVPILFAYTGPGAVIFVSVFPLIAASLCFVRAGRTRLGCTCLLGVVFIVGFVQVNEKTSLLTVKRVKSYNPHRGQEEERPKLFERWHPVSRVAAYTQATSNSPAESFESRPPDWGYPRLIEVSNDAGARTFVYPQMSATQSRELFEQDVSDLAYRFRPIGKALIIGIGGGKDILAARSFDAKEIIGVELNPIMVDLTQDIFADFTGRPFSDPRIRIVIDEGRTYVASRNEHYDLIKMAGTDTWVASAMGAHALAESYLYTREAISDYLAHLEPEGYVSITRWFPKESIRLVALVAEAMRGMAIQDPEARILMARNVSAHPTLTVIAKKGRFTEAETQRFAEAVSRAGHLLVYAPGWEKGYANQRNEVLHRQILSTEGLQAVSERLALNLSPPTDDRPFFFNLITLGDARQGKVADSWSFILQHSRAMHMLFSMLWISLAVVVLFVLVPVLLSRWSSRVTIPPLTRLGVNVYFLALGAGYLLVEVPLLQRFILFLGHPVYSLMVVLFSMLVASGIGSLVAARLPLNRRGLLIGVVTASAGIVLLANFCLPGLLRSLIGLPIAARVALSVLLIAPIGLMLGMPFPTGLRIVHAISPSLIPWAWAVNGAASVAAPILAMIIAIASGFTTTQSWGAFSYLVAAVVLVFLPRGAAMRVVANAGSATAPVLK